MLQVMSVQSININEIFDMNMLIDNDFITHCSITVFLTNVPSLYTLEITRKPGVFWCFQGILKRNICQKSVSNYWKRQYEVFTFSSLPGNINIVAKLCLRLIVSLMQKLFGNGISCSDEYYENFVKSPPLTIL